MQVHCLCIKEYKNMQSSTGKNHAHVFILEEKKKKKGDLAGQTRPTGKQVIIIKE